MTSTPAAEPAAADSGNEKSFMAELLGSFSPKFVALTDDVLYGDIWTRTELGGRDRSIVAVSAFVAGGNASAVEGYLHFAKANGVTRDEVVELLTHLAFYGAWPQAVTAMTITKSVFTD